MTAGNQGRKFDLAQEALDAKPGDKKLEEALEKAREDLNGSHSRANTGKRF